MKKTICILMLIAATMAVKQSSAQARPSVVKSPVIRASAPAKSLGIINHHVSPPPLTRLGPAKVMSMGTTPTAIVNTNGDGSITATTITTNPDGSTTSSSTTYNTDGTVRSTTNPTTTPLITTDSDGTITINQNQPINKNSSDEQLPPPYTIRIDSINRLKITFVWSGA
jgi:hypothetical protein